MAEPTVLVHRSPDELAQAVCARLITTLVDAQSAGGVPHWVLTGGGIADRIHRAVAASPARGAVDWSRVELWWGDERFLPDGDPERNETQARAALLDELGGVLPADHVHPMAGPADGGPATPEESAEAYARELAAHAPDGAQVPPFDVVLLGVGPDGHVASLFPGHEALAVAGRATVGVHGSPKPPPLRVSLTFDAIRSAAQVWLFAAGAEKAAAVASALA